MKKYIFLFLFFPAMLSGQNTLWNKAEATTIAADDLLFYTQSNVVRKLKAGTLLGVVSDSLDLVRTQLTDSCSALRASIGSGGGSGQWTNTGGYIVNYPTSAKVSIGAGGTGSWMLDVTGNQRIIGYLEVYKNQNTSIGRSAGQNITTGTGNTSLGYNAGYSVSAGTNNTFVGGYSGNNIGTGYENTMIGAIAGGSATPGSFANVCLGYASGVNIAGSYNVMLGSESGYSNEESGNTMIGYRAGYDNVNGLDNVFIGKLAGSSETGSDKLYIANSGTATPLVYGDFDSEFLTINGDLNITGLGKINTDTIATMAYARSVIECSSGSSGSIQLSDGSGAFTNDASLYLDADTVRVPSIQVNGALVIADTHGAGFDTISGSHTTFDLTGISFVEFNGTAHATVKGFSGGVKGQRVVFVNTTTAYHLTFNENSTGTQKIQTTGTSCLIGYKNHLGYQPPSVEFICDGTEWHQLGDGD
jgi:hypothetical protein